MAVFQNILRKYQLHNKSKQHIGVQLSFSKLLFLSVVLCFALFICYETPGLAKSSCDENASAAEQIGEQCQQKDNADKTTDTEQKTEQTTEGPSLAWTFVKLVVALAIILGLIYLLYRLVSKRTRAFQNYGAIKNVGGVSVGNNRSVQLIRIGEEILVVGVGDSVRLLKEIDDPEIVQTLLNNEEPPDLLQKNVSKLLTWTKQSIGSKGQSHEKSSNEKSFQEHLKALVKQRSNQIVKQLRKDSDDE